MKGIPLDQLLENFFANQFAGFKTKVELPDDLLTTPVPVVELPMKIDTNYLLSLVASIDSHDMVRKTYPYEKYPRYSNWKIKLLWAERYENTLLENIFFKKKTAPIDDLAPDDTSAKIKNYLYSLGIDVNFCTLSIFHPGGYLRPHRDIGLNQTPLNYFWLPLNNPEGSELKIYPYGTVDIKLGNMYLLNQENFVHAVINHSDVDRYVLVGHFVSMDEKFEQILAESIMKEYAGNLT